MIESLTAEQTQSMRLYRDQWIEIGRDTSPIDPQVAIDSVKLAYTLADQEEPKYFVFTDGPMEAMKLLAVADQINLTKDDFDLLSAQGVYALTDKLKALSDQIMSKSDIKVATVWPAYYGQHEAGWIAYHQFFADHFGLSEKSQGLREIGKNCGWVWMYSNLVIISGKPTRVTTNSQGQLHNEKSAAVEYADGTKVYSFNGVSIPEEWVLERNTIDPSVILKCSDTDKRAAGIALYGYDRLKHQLDYNIIEGDPNTDIGALVEITIPGLPRKGRFLEAICPRNGPVFLGVPSANPWDEKRPIVDAVGAQAFLARLPRSAYEHPEIRT